MGGCYDLLMRTPRRGHRFAVHLDELDRLERPHPVGAEEQHGLGHAECAPPIAARRQDVRPAGVCIGYGCTEGLQRHPAVWRTPGGGHLVTSLCCPSDVAIYVEHGAADGHVGKDILTEALPMSTSCWIPVSGRCRMRGCPGGLQG